MQKLSLIAVGVAMGWLLLSSHESEFGDAVVLFGERLGNYGRPAALHNAAESPAQARDALSMLAQLSPHLAFDGEDRLCVVGASSVSHELPDGTTTPTSLATACLFDLRTEKGWRDHTLWSSDLASEVLSVEFRGNHLLVTWVDLEGATSIARIEWPRRTDPNPGAFEHATQQALAADAAPRRR